MKVSELIKKLQEYPEDLEINVWNGFVSDYQPINEEYPIMTKKLYRHSLYYYSLILKADYCQKNKIKDTCDDPVPLEEYKKIKQRAKELYSQNYNNLVQKYDSPDEEMIETWYDSDYVEILILQPGLANKSCMDRCGTLYY